MILIKNILFILVLSLFTSKHFCAQMEMRIGNKRTVLDRLDGSCGGDKSMKITFIPKTMVAQGKKIVMNATFNVYEDIDYDPTLSITIIRCKVRENPDTCEHFHSFTTNKYCHLIGTRSPLWSPFFDHITPAWRCPLKKGEYIVEEAVFDVSSFLLFPIQGWFWKVTAEQLNPNTKAKIFCLITETQVVAVGRGQ